MKSTIMKSIIELYQSIQTVPLSILPFMICLPSEKETDDSSKLNLPKLINSEIRTGPPLVLQSRTSEKRTMLVGELIN